MDRLLAVALGVVLGAAAPAEAQECVWKDPTTPLALKEGDPPLLTAKWDREWFKCAKKAGGTLTAQLLAGAPGKLEVVKEEKVNGQNMGVWLSGVCQREPKPTRQQVRLVGTGPMARLSWEGPESDIFCPRCTWAGDDNMLVVHTAGFATEPGQVTFEGKLDERWFACAKPGSTLEMRFYLAATAVEARELTKPTFVVRGLEASHRFKKKFPKASLCAEKGAFLGYQLFGTGEMQRVNGAGRSVLADPCR